MSHEIESNFVEESKNEARQCQFCKSCVEQDDTLYCQELGTEVPAIGYCDFFSSRD